MPLKVVCYSCGFVLHESPTITRSITSIVNGWGGKCPKCMSTLFCTPFEVHVKKRKKYKKLQ